MNLLLYLDEGTGLMGTTFKLSVSYIVGSWALIKPKTLILELPLHSLGPKLIRFGSKRVVDNLFLEFILVQ